MSGGDGSAGMGIPRWVSLLRKVFKKLGLGAYLWALCHGARVSHVFDFLLLFHFRGSGLTLLQLLSCLFLVGYGVGEVDRFFCKMTKPPLFRGLSYWFRFHVSLPGVGWWIAAAGEAGAGRVRDAWNGAVGSAPVTGQWQAGFACFDGWCGTAGGAGPG